MPTLHLTSGSFPVPNTPAAAGASLHLFVSSFQDEDALVHWLVNRIEEDGERVRVGDGTVRVAGHGAEQVSLRPSDVEGRIVEVNFTLPSRLVVPTAAVLVSFLADESREVALWLGPSDFAQRHAARITGGKMWRARRR